MRKRFKPSRSSRRVGQKRAVRSSIAFAATLALALTACTSSRDTRTPAERDRDAETWTRARELRVTTGIEQVQGCTSLGVISERYFEEPPTDPFERPVVRSWPEHVLRYKTARLGGDTADRCPTIRTWSGELNESRVLGEAYHCAPPTVAGLPDPGSAGDTR